MSPDLELMQWIKRCRDGDEIPGQAVIEHKLNRWFAFTMIGGKQVALAERDGRRMDFTTGELVTDPDYIEPPC
jgi:hypothetical protein